MVFLRQRLGAAARNSAVVLLAGASLAACATAGGPANGPAASNHRPPHAERGDRTPPRSDGAPRGTMKPYQVNGVWYRPHEDPDYDETGLASWYGAQFHNRSTADGELFDMDAPSGAHKTLPLPCIVEVTNLENGRKLRVRINDRGPFVQGRILDLSREAARQLGFYEKGTARVRVRYLGPAEPGVGYAMARAARERARVPPPAEVATNAEAPWVRARGAVESTTLAPPAGSTPSGGYAPTVARWTPPPITPASRSGGAVQAAAFSDRANAERAAARLASTGEPSIEPLDRGGQTLWKVVVRARAGDDAESLRDRIEAEGFPGARVVR